jgi:hypothetical protein
MLSGLGSDSTINRARVGLSEGSGVMDSVIGKFGANAHGGSWPIAAFAALQNSGRYWSNNGHWPELARNGSVENDP